MKKDKTRAVEYLILTPAEERVVCFLKTQKEPVSVSEISRGIFLARTSIYNAVESLIEKKVLKKNRFKYFLVSNNFAETEKYNVKKKISDFLGEALLLKKGEVIYSIESDEEIEYFLKVEGGLPEWQKAIADKGIVLKGIGSSRALTLFRDALGDKLNKKTRHSMARRSGAARFMAESLFGSCVLISFCNSVVFFSRKNEYFYRIDDVDVARFVQTIIDVFYLNLQYKPLFVG